MIASGDYEVTHVVNVNAIRHECMVESHHGAYFLAHRECAGEEVAMNQVCRPKPALKELSHRGVPECSIEIADGDGRGDKRTRQVTDRS